MQYTFRSPLERASLRNGFRPLKSTEGTPIFYRNDWDDEDKPHGYVYIAALEHPEVPRLHDVQGCRSDCTCLQENCGQSFSLEAATKCTCRGKTYVRGSKAVGEELRDTDLQSGSPEYECGPACACDLLCQNRVSQRGLQYKVVVLKTQKGWSAFAGEDIKAGQFVCQYAGELLGTAEAALRLKQYDEKADGPGHALLVIREVLPSLTRSLRMNIDATLKGNVARFMNHDCSGGNLVPMVVRLTGKLIPHVGMYSKRNICKGEELTFMYGEPNAGRTVGTIEENLVETSNSNAKPLPKVRPCLCGAPACLGYLPSESIE